MTKREGRMADLRSLNGKVEDKASWSRGRFVSNTGFLRRWPSSIRTRQERGLYGWPTELESREAQKRFTVLKRFLVREDSASASLATRVRARSMENGLIHS